MVRMSATRETSKARSIATSSSSVRVEWPTVKTRALFQLAAPPIWLPTSGFLGRIGRDPVKDDLARSLTRSPLPQRRSESARSNPALRACPAALLGRAAVDLLRNSSLAAGGARA